MAVQQSPSESLCQNSSWNPTLEKYLNAAYIHLFNLTELCNNYSLVNWMKQLQKTNISNAKSRIFGPPAQCRTNFLSQVHDYLDICMQMCLFQWIFCYLSEKLLDQKNKTTYLFTALSSCRNWDQFSLFILRSIKETS